MTALPAPQVHIHSSQPLTHRAAHDFLSSFLTLSESHPSHRPDSVLTERGPVSQSSGAGSSITLSNLDRIRRGIAGERIGGLPPRISDIQREEANRNNTAGVKRRDGFGIERAGREFVKRPQDGDVQSGLDSNREVGAKRRGGIQNVTVDVGEGEEEPVEMTRESDDWQDKDQYEHAQVEVDAEAREDMADPSVPDSQKSARSKARGGGDAMDIVVNKDDQGGVGDDEDASGSKKRKREREEMGREMGMQGRGQGQMSKQDREARKAAKKERMKDERRKKEREKAG